MATSAGIIRGAPKPWPTPVFVGVPAQPLTQAPTQLPPQSTSPAPPPPAAPSPPPDFVTGSGWDVVGISSIGAVQATAATSPEPPTLEASALLDAIYLLTLPVREGNTVRECTFTHNGRRHVASASGEIRTDINPSTGAGQTVGQLGLTTGEVRLTNWQPGANSALEYWSMYQDRPRSGISELPGDVYFLGRTSAAPLRPGSFQIVFTMADGEEGSAVADVDGYINHSRVVGFFDAEHGVFELVFRSPVVTAYGDIDVSALGIPGVAYVHVDAVQQSTLRYNGVAYRYVPVDPEIVGVDPVRLPSDGRVPIFAEGDYVCVHTTEELPERTAEMPFTFSVGMTRVTRITLLGADGKRITTGWTADLNAGTVTIDDATDWLWPVTPSYTIEHDAKVQEVDISGAITLNRQLPHDFPLNKSFISSVLVQGDKFARVGTVFDQQSWAGIKWQDFVDGNPAVATYNTSISPLQVDNIGAITERWALRFRNDGVTFDCIGEHVGQIATGTINADFSPINPNTETRYFTVPALGWGTGWIGGNTVFFPTYMCGDGFAAIRVIQPGSATVQDHTFGIAVRLDVDRPGLGD